jgi:hypothetical protein
MGTSLATLLRHDDPMSIDVWNNQETLRIRVGSETADQARRTANRDDA